MYFSSNLIRSENWEDKKKSGALNLAYTFILNLSSTAKYFIHSLWNGGDMFCRESSDFLLELYQPYIY